MIKDETVAVRLDQEMLRILDRLRREQEDLPSRAELIRRLIAKAGKEPSK